MVTTGSRLRVVGLFVHVIPDKRPDNVVDNDLEAIASRRRPPTENLFSMQDLSGTKGSRKLVYVRRSKEGQVELLRLLHQLGVGNPLKQLLVHGRLELIKVRADLCGPSREEQAKVRNANLLPLEACRDY